MATPAPAWLVEAAAHVLHLAIDGQPRAGCGQAILSRGPQDEASWDDAIGSMCYDEAEPEPILKVLAECFTRAVSLTDRPVALDRLVQASDTKEALFAWGKMVSGLIVKYMISVMQNPEFYPEDRAMALPRSASGDAAATLLQPADQFVRMIAGLPGWTEIDSRVIQRMVEFLAGEGEQVPAADGTGCGTAAEEDEVSVRAVFGPVLRLLQAWALTGAAFDECRFLTAGSSVMEDELAAQRAEAEGADALELMLHRAGAGEADGSPLIGSVHELKAGLAGIPDVAITEPATFRPLVRAWRKLLSVREIALLLLGDPAWLSTKPAPTGQLPGTGSGPQLELGSPLGALFAVGPTAAVLDGAAPGGAGPSLHELLMDPDQAAQVPRPSERRLNETPGPGIHGRYTALVDRIRAGTHEWVAGLHALMRLLLKADKRDNDCRRVFTWLGAALQANRHRSTIAFTRTGQSHKEPVCSAAFLHNLGEVLLLFCSKICDASQPSSAEIDLRFLSVATPGPLGSGGGLFDVSEEQLLNRDLVPKHMLESAAEVAKQRSAGEGAAAEQPAGAGGAASGGGQWVDQRNLARQQQFVAARRELLKEAVGEAQLQAMEAAGDQAAAVPAPERYSGRTKFIFLAMRALHLGDITSVGRHQQLAEHSNKARGRFAELQQLVPFAPHLAPQADKLRRMLDRWVRQQTLLDALLMDRGQIGPRMELYSMVAITLLRAAQHPNELAQGSVMPAALVEGQKSLPMPAPTLPVPVPSPILSGLPEFVVMDVASVLTWADSNFHGTITARDLLPQRVVPLVRFMVAFLASPVLTHNPNIPSVLVSGIASLCPAAHNYQLREKLATGRIPLLPLHQSLVNDLTAQRYLGRAALRFFAMAETTGGHAQFYDKFRHRVDACTIIDYLSRYESFRRNMASVTSASRHEQAAMVKCVAMLLNDLHHHIGEAAEAYDTMRREETDRDAGNWAALDAGERRQREQGLESYHRRGHSWILHLAINLRLFEILTDVIPAAFLNSRMQDRSAQLINHLARVLLVEKPGMRDALAAGSPPVKSLYDHGQLCDMVANGLHALLSASARTVVAEVDAAAAAAGGASAEEAGQMREAQAPVVRPPGAPASWSPFAAALAREDPTSILAEPVGLLMQLHREGAKPGFAREAAVAGVAETARAGQASGAELDDEDLDDAPEEVLCAISYELMRDPVRLPSGNVVERSVVLRIIMDSGADPFTREPIAEADLHTAEDVKAKIAEWKEAKMAEKRAAAGK